ncbi:MAG: thioredoxin TrxC [Burkholderiales bacterium]
MEAVCPHCAAVNRVPDTRLADQPKCGKCGEPLITGAPVALTARTFDKFTSRNDLPVVVDFWAEWCGPCKMMAPVFARAAQDQAGRTLFAKLDTESEGEIAQRFGIRSIPTLILFQSGREKARISGALDGASLARWLAQNA